MAQLVRAAQRPPVTPPSLSTPTCLTYKAAYHTGAMIALFVPDDVAQAIALPDGEDASELHVTLAYLGKAADIEDPGAIHDILRLISQVYAPLMGVINGTARFCTEGDGQDDVFLLLPDLPALPEFRQQIISELSANNVDHSREHGFIPHITLKYLPKHQSTPFDRHERLSLEFATISLVLAGERFDYPLTGARSLTEKAGARHTKQEFQTIQRMHDMAVGLGAVCKRDDAEVYKAQVGIRERLAAYAHDAWAGWMKHFFAKCEEDGQGNVICSEDYARNIWRQILADYDNLTEKEKDSDREQADRILAIVRNDGTKIHKSQNDAPNYRPASTIERCDNCVHFHRDTWCELYDFVADLDFVCDSWEQRPVAGLANGGSLIQLSQAITVIRGGGGSGNWGHVGRPGLLGGSRGGAGLGAIGAPAGAPVSTRRQLASTLSGRRAAGGFTSEYHQFKAEFETNKAFADEFLADDPAEHKAFIDEAKDMVATEAEVSRTARRFGHIPGEMKQSDWSDLSAELELETKEQLALSTQARRDAVGNKARGPARDIAQVGGQDRRVRGGAVSARDARRMVSNINADTQHEASLHMAQKLKTLGHQPRTVNNLNYNQRRKLLFEIGDGKPLSGKIGDLSRTERQRVIDRATGKQRLVAKSTSISPRSAKGLDTWEMYQESYKRSGKGNTPPFVPDDLWGDDTETRPKWMN